MDRETRNSNSPLVLCTVGSTYNGHGGFAE
jgi:hypothetical protein